MNTWIHVYIHSSRRSPSWHHLADCQRQRWQYQSCKSLFENPGVIEVHELQEVFVHSENHSLVHQIVTKRSVARGAMFARHAFLPASSDIPLGGKIEFAVLAGKKILTCWPQGVHYRNRKGTGIKGTRHKRYRNYSRELRECTPLPFGQKVHPSGGVFIRKIRSLHSSLLISQTTTVVFKINSSYFLFQNYYLTILKLL